MRARLATLALVLAAVAASSGGAPAPVHADNGFCGVRSDRWFENGVEVYVVRNKCRHRHSFRVWLPGVHRYASSGCRRIGRHAYGYYTDHWVDKNWQVRNC